VVERRRERRDLFRGCRLSATLGRPRPRRLAISRARGRSRRDLFHVWTDVGYRIATEQITSSLTLVLSSLVLAGELEVLVNSPVVIT
jgi:hypothetical protein